MPPVAPDKAHSDPASRDRAALDSCVGSVHEHRRLHGRDAPGPAVDAELAIDPAQFGRIVASYTIAAGLAGLLASSIMDRFGRKAAFLTLYSGFLLGTLFCGLSRGYLMLLAARVLTGGFGGILGGLALAIIADVFPEERRGRATGS